MTRVTLFLVVAGVGVACLGASMAHDAAWWLAAEVVGGLMVGAGWGLKP